MNRRLSSLHRQLVRVFALLCILTSVLLAAQAQAALPYLLGTVPNSGPAAGGTIVTLTGNNLSGATDITFGDISATGFTVIDDTTIYATTPAHAAVRSMCRSKPLAALAPTPTPLSRRPWPTPAAPS